MCNKYTHRSTDVYELPTTRDIKQVRHFKDPVSVGPFTLEYLFFFSYRKTNLQDLADWLLWKRTKAVAHFSVSSQAYLTQEWVSQ